MLSSHKPQAAWITLASSTGSFKRAVTRSACSVGRVIIHKV